jgi:hypothetical protein
LEAELVERKASIDQALTAKKADVQASVKTKVADLKAKYEAAQKKLSALKQASSVGTGPNWWDQARPCQRCNRSQDGDEKHPSQEMSVARGVVRKAFHPTTFACMFGAISPRTTGAALLLR